MTVGFVLQSVHALLLRQGVSSARLDAEILLSRAWKKDRAWILAHPEKVVPSKVAAQFRRFISRRSRREPLAYILGYKEFYGLRFTVNRHVLIPRPETELLIEETVKQLSNKAIPTLRSGLRLSTKSRCLGAKQLGLVAQSLSGSVALVDVGTGSGCIAVTLAKLFPRAKVFATDTSQEALAVARKNARRHDAKVNFLRGDLLEPILPQLSSRPSPFDSLSLAQGRLREWRDPSTAPRLKCRGFARDDIKEDGSLVILANLPYIPARDIKKLAPEIRDHEPRSALDGGRDGLREYRRLFRQIATTCHSDQAPQSGARGGIPFASKEIPRLRPAEFTPTEASGLGMTMSIICEIDPSQARAFRAMAKKILPTARLSLVPSPRKARCAILSVEAERRG